MTNKKETREKIGYTHEKRQNNPDSWCQQALSFKEASVILHEHKDSINAGIKVFQFNAALSLELILKAILALKGGKIPPKHILRELCVEAEVILSEDQECTLDLLAESLIWLGRYPAPKKQGQWNNYHDNILEKHIKRFQVGNTHTTTVNKKRFPSMENYKVIWEICLNKFNELKLQKDIHSKY